MSVRAVGSASVVHRPAVPDPRPELVQTTDHYYHVRVRPAGAFAELRTTQAAADHATDVVGPGADVREGRVGPGTWAVESALVPLDAATGGPEAETLVEELVERIES